MKTARARVMNTLVLEAGRKRGVKSPSTMLPTERRAGPIAAIVERVRFGWISVAWTKTGPTKGPWFLWIVNFVLSMGEAFSRYHVDLEKQSRSDSESGKR